MKINATPASAATKSARAADGANAPTNRPDVSGGDDKTSPLSDGGRDFADVLDDRTRLHSEQTSAFKEDVPGWQKHETQRERASEDRTAPPKERLATEKPGEKRDGDDDNRSESDLHGHGYEGLSPREMISPRAEFLAPANARAILHVVDLERIVALVRSQIFAGGRQEITVELARSVLEGLRIKLSRDASGRLDAEFIAGSERVRTQLDARTDELAGLLRSRGVQLATLKTSIGTDASGQHDDQQQDAEQQRTAALEDARNAVQHTDSASAVDAARTESAIADVADTENSTESHTYRA